MTAASATRANRLITDLQKRGRGALRTTRFYCPQRFCNSYSEYQNPIRNTYPPVPRPPQTQAAHFKRLYRK